MTGSGHVPGRRFFDHTADVGMEVFGDTPADLFARAALAMTDLLVWSEPCDMPQIREICVEGRDWPDLWVNFLREILYLLQGEGLIVRDVRLDRIDPGRLAGRLSVCPFDPARQSMHGEIKAVTHHQASVRRTKNGWKGRVIFDV